MIDRSESHLIARERRNRGGSNNESGIAAGIHARDRAARPLRARATSQSDTTDVPRVEPGMRPAMHVPRTRLK
jgi:hypothetical protein